MNARIIEFRYCEQCPYYQFDAQISDSKVWTKGWCFHRQGQMEVGYNPEIPDSCPLQPEGVNTFSEADYVIND